MALTWQDVAGQVRAPDFSDAARLITQGITGIGDSVKKLGNEPDERRQADLAKQMVLANMQQKAAADHAQLGRQLGHDLKVDRKEKDQEEFGAAQSILEAEARDIALRGGKFEDLLQSEAYQKLDEGARAYGSAHLSDAFLRGDETRIQQAERAADNARQQSNFNRSLAQSESHFRQSQARQDRELNLRMKQLEKAERAERESRGLISDDPLTNAAWRQRAAQTQAQLAPIQRGVELYGKMSPREAAIKGKTDGNWFRDGDAEAQEIAKRVEKKTGKKVDTWMINQLLVEGGGANNGFLNIRGQFDEGSAAGYLEDLVQLQDAAKWNQQFFDRMTTMAREGATYNPETLAKFPVRTGVDPAAVFLPKPTGRKPMGTF